MHANPPYNSLGCLAMQQGLGRSHHLREQRWRRHVEPEGSILYNRFLLRADVGGSILLGGRPAPLHTDVLPLKTLESRDGVDELLRELVEPIAVLLLGFQLSQPFRRLTALPQLERCRAEQGLGLWASNMPPQMLVAVENVNGLGIVLGSLLVALPQFCRSGAPRLI